MLGGRDFGQVGLLRIPAAEHWTGGKYDAVAAAGLLGWVAGVWGAGVLEAWVLGDWGVCGGRGHGGAGVGQPGVGVGRFQGKEPDGPLDMVQNDGAAREDQYRVRGGRRDVRSAGLALELIAQAAQPAQGEAAGIAIRGADCPASPDCVQPAEEGSAHACRGGAGGDDAFAGPVRDRLAVRPAVVREDAEAAALGGG